MLVQKPVAFNLAPAPLHTHRRHPSAPPAVVVQPTRTPGLLSIAKPQRTAPQKQLPSAQRRNNAPKSKQAQVARAPALLNSAEIRPALAVLQPPASPTPVRGRVAPKHAKDKANRSASQTRKPNRQPSPPVQAVQMPESPSQAEAPFSNPFDPFLDSNKAPKAIPVPQAKNRPIRQPQPQLARSDPLSSNMRPRSLPKTGVRGNFPICDDMTDAGDISEAETPPPRTPPATPPRKQRAADIKARTVPASFASTPLGHPLFDQSPSPPRRANRKHIRSPSEGVVFHMSSDEDAPAASQGMLASISFKRAQNKPPTTPSPSLSRATGVTFMTEGYFASSAFQNSPSPDELPDPTLF
ncbi:hypothetical protein EST38_g6944 [Candolleomyces aberdarensis]|uniref:Uncharacterized protein n=1 Tax=Candolleomyces aberdarensis TaxID=2316362 RepID=A0A4Q2DIN6_9AGAR|nr:hypothetical protein EST38_g6944 [Candolleomyces aberdarensis]